MEMPGWNFEDSEFEEPRDRAQSSGGPYTAKQCEPQWFCDDVNNEELLTVMKFRGDLAYRQEDFQKALSEYSSCSVLLSANAVMRRDVQESQARCLIALGRYDEALEIAEILKKGVSNTDHLTCVLNLQATIYSNIGNLWQSGSCLQQLISLHPFNPWFWKRLAELYGSLFLAVSDCRTVSCGANTCSVCVEKRLVNKHQPMIGEEIHRGDQWHLKQSVRSQDTCDCDDRTTQQRLLNGMEDCGKCSLLQNCTNREELRINSCASFIRASLLLQLIQPQQASFVLEKNLKTQVEIEERLKDFGLREEIRALITEIMEEDLSPERIRDEGQIDLKTTLASTLVVMPSDNEFKEKWFKKICSVLVGDL